ncbi:MAG: hypothetical protein AAGE52_04650 [Myxococcota bacterium]
MRTTDEVREAHAAIREVYLSTDRVIAWVVDATAVGRATAVERRIVSEHEKSVAPLARRWCAGLAVVIPNELVRGFFTAITWLAPLRYPHKVFSNRLEATAWAENQLVERAR